MSHMKGAKSRIIDFLPNEANYRSRQRCPRCERSTVEVTELATMICYACPCGYSVDVDRIDRSHDRSRRTSFD